METGDVLTALSVVVYMGWWPVCGRPCRPAEVPRWRRRRRWAAAGLSGGLETGMSDWHVPTCKETPATHTHTLDNPAVIQGHTEEWDDILGLFWASVLDLQCDSLRDADADSGWQDTVSADLPLRSIFHHSAKPACPGERESDTDMNRHHEKMEVGSYWKQQHGQNGTE